MRPQANTYGHGLNAVCLFLAVGAVVGLVKSVELLLLAAHCAEVVRIVDRAFGFVLVEKGAGPLPI